MPICNVEPQGGGWRAGDIADNAGIEAEKVIHQYTLSRLTTADAATAVTTITLPLHTIHGSSAELMSLTAWLTTAITAASDRTIIVDLQRSTAGGAFATVLGTTITFDQSIASRTVLAGVINTTTAIEGDIFQLVVTVAGSSGTQGKGLVVSLSVQERLA